MAIWRRLGSFWRWLFLGPPLVTQERAEASDGRLALRLPDQVPDYEAATVALCFVGGFWGLPVVFAAAVSAHELSKGGRHAGEVALVVAAAALALACLFGLLLRGLRERRRWRVTLDRRTLEAGLHASYFALRWVEWPVRVDARVLRRLYRDGATEEQGRWLIREAVSHLSRHTLARWAWRSEDEAVAERVAPPEHPHYPLARQGDRVRVSHAGTEVEAGVGRLVRVDAAGVTAWRAAEVERLAVGFPVTNPGDEDETCLAEITVVGPAQAGVLLAASAANRPAEVDALVAEFEWVVHVLLQRAREPAANHEAIRR